MCLFFLFSVFFRLQSAFFPHCSLVIFDSLLSSEKSDKDSFEAKSNLWTGRCVSVILAWSLSRAFQRGKRPPSPRFDEEPLSSKSIPIIRLDSVLLSTAGDPRALGTIRKICYFFPVELTRHFSYYLDVFAFDCTTTRFPLLDLLPPNFSFS